MMFHTCLVSSWDVIEQETELWWFHFPGSNHTSNPPFRIQQKISLSNIWPIVSSIRTITFPMVRKINVHVLSIFCNFLKLLNEAFPFCGLFIYQKIHNAVGFFLIKGVDVVLTGYYGHLYQNPANLFIGTLENLRLYIHWVNFLHQQYLLISPCFFGWLKLNV